MQDEEKDIANEKKDVSQGGMSFKNAPEKPLLEYTQYC